MDKLTAVIAAGGYGTRCNSSVPKALIRVKTITYLETLLIEAIQTGISDAVIYCNRQDYLTQMKKIAKRYVNTTVILDEGVRSTIHLAIRAASYCDSNNILFMYGHSPHPASNLIRLLEAKKDRSAVVSLFEESSKRNRYAWLDNRYVEPPYLITRDILETSKYGDWASFFKSLSHRVVGIPMRGPSEFNNSVEELRFEHYVGAWFLSRPNKAFQPTQNPLRGFRSAEPERSPLHTNQSATRTTSSASI